METLLVRLIVRRVLLFVPAAAGAALLVHFALPPPPDPAQARVDCVVETEPTQADPAPAEPQQPATVSVGPTSRLIVVGPGTAAPATRRARARGANAPASSGGKETPGATEEGVLRGLATRHEQLRSCYAAFKAEHPSARGEVTLSWVIAPSGRVVSGRVEEQRSSRSVRAVGPCLLGEVRQTRFPRSAGHDVVHVTHRFSLQPKDGARATSLSISARINRARTTAPSELPALRELLSEAALGDVLDCYEARVRKRPMSKGEFSLAVAQSARGSLSLVDVVDVIDGRQPSAALRRCLKRRVAKWTLPATGTSERLLLPIVLTRATDG